MDEVASVTIEAGSVVGCVDGGLACDDVFIRVAFSGSDMDMGKISV